MPVIVTIFWLWAKGYDLNWGLGVIALVNIILIHAAGNVWSDYFDFKKGVDAIDTYGVKILTTGQFTPSEVMRLSVGIQIAAILMGVLTSSIGADGKVISAKAFRCSGSDSSESRCRYSILRLSTWPWATS